MDTCLAIICLSNLFVTAETGIQHIPNVPQGYEYNLYDRTAGSPLLAAFSVGVEIPISPKWRASAYFRHESMPTIRQDVGVNAFWTTLTWRPFK